MRDRRLRQAEWLELADAALVGAGELVHDREARRVAESLEAHAQRLALAGRQRRRTGSAATTIQYGQSIH